MKKTISIILTFVMLFTTLSFASLTAFASGESADAAQEITEDKAADYKFEKNGKSDPNYWFKFTPSEDGLYEFKTVNGKTLDLSGQNLKVYQSAEDAKADKNSLKYVSYNTVNGDDYYADYFVDTYELKKDTAYYVFVLVYVKEGVETATMGFSAGKHVHEFEDYFCLPSGGDLGEYGKVCKTCGVEVDVNGFEAPLFPQGLKLKAGKKRFTASWKKVKCVKGYQLQYSTSKKFKKKYTKTKTIKGAKNVKKTIKKLKKNKLYYVRVRSYTVIAGHNVYSKWTKAKKVKTK